MVAQLVLKFHFARTVVSYFQILGGDPSLYPYMLFTVRKVTEERHSEEPRPPCS